MANVSFYFDRRSPRKDGAVPLRLAIRFNNKVVMIATDVCVTPDQWQQAQLRIVNHPQRKALNSYLDTLRVNAEQTMRDLVVEGKPLTTKLVRSRITGSAAGDVEDSFFNVFKCVSEDPRNKERTHEIYRATLKKLKAYAEEMGVAPESWRFEDITRSWIADFDAWLMDCSPSKNARNIHLRNIRHVCNVAVGKHITNFYDFRGYAIKAVPTVKRSLSVDKLRQLFSLEVEHHQQKYLDMFKLIFCFIGINTIDLCHLRKTDVREGRIEYDRSKTGQRPPLSPSRQS